MAMTADDYTEQLGALLPQGPAWPREGSQCSRMLSGLAAELARIDGRTDALIAEVDPRTVTELIDEWELVSDTTGSTLAQRRAALHARMISLGGQSRAYFVAIAGALGYTITIEELQPFRASKNRVGDVIAVAGVVYAWRVSVFGVAAASDLEALFRELKPAHTAVTFIYPAGSLAGAMSGSITVGTASLTGSIRLVNARTDSFVPIAARACTCGVFSMTADGIWTYVLDSHDPDAIALPAKATLAESVTVSASDGSLSGTVLITVVGIDDAGTIGGSDTGSTTEDVTTTCSGVLTVSDPDTGEAVFVAQTTSSSYGTFVLATNGVWTYTLGAGAQALAGGTTVSDTFTARSKGGASHVVAVTITGTNDVPTITGTGTGSLTVSAGATVSGTLGISDADTGQSSFAAATQAGSYGALTITAAGAWTYTIDTSNAAILALSEGATLSDAMVVKSSDGSAARTITITITGTGPAYWSNVTLLLNFGGADGSRAITDSSSSALTVTPFGDAHIATANSKFGGAALVLDGSGDFLTVPGSPAWSCHQNMTIECWLWHGAHSRLEYVATNRVSSRLNNVWVLEVSATGLLGFVWWDNNASQGGYCGGWDIGSAMLLPVNAWTHVRVCVVGKVVYLFIAGALAATTTMTNVPSAISNALVIGRSAAEPGTRDFTGCIDDFRVTTGVARSTSAFTPPASEFNQYSK